MSMIPATPTGRPVHSNDEFLLDEALPDLSTADQIFANAPAGTRTILLTVEDQAIRVRFAGSGNDPVAGGIGQLLPVGQYELRRTQAQALEIYAVEEAATATGTITYLGEV